MQKENFHKDVIENMICGYSFHEAIYDKNGKFCSYRYIDVNKKFEELTGVKREDIIGKEIFEVFPNTEQHWIDIFGSVVSTGKSIVYEDYHKETKKYYQVYIWRSKPDTFSCTFLDITEKEKQFQELKRSEEKYRNLVENQHSLIVRINLKGKITFVNDSYCKKFNVKREDILGSNFAPTIHPEDKWKTEETIKKLFKNKKSKMIQKVWDPNIKKYVHIFWHDKFIFNGDDKEIQAVGHDVSEIKELEKDLQESNRDLKSFAFITSHDLQAPLRKISIFSSLLKDHIEKNNIDLGEDGYKFLNKIEKSTKTMQNLIKDILEYSSISNDSNPTEICNINNIIKDVIDGFEVKIREVNPSIITEDIPSMKCDPTQIKQLFSNLLSNAFKFRQKNIKLKIGISSEISEDKRECIILFKDNGIGIDMKYSEDIFKMFKKLHSKTEYPGSGIGLALIDRIAKKHQWKIEVNSQENEGSCFKFIIPIGD